VKGDEVTGASVLARDITGSARRNNASRSYSNLCRKAWYISNPEGKLVDGESALVSILGIRQQRKSCSTCRPSD